MAALHRTLLAVSVLAACACSATAFHLPLSGGLPVLRGARPQHGVSTARVSRGRMGGLRMSAKPGDVKMSREERMATGAVTNDYNKALALLPITQAWFLIQSAFCMRRSMVGSR